MTEFTNVSEKTVLDGTELMLGASSTDETIAQKFSIAKMNEHNGYVNVRDYGALGEGYLGADDSIAILRARDEALAQDRTLYFPYAGFPNSSDNNGYRMTEELVVPEGIPIVMDSQIIRTTNFGSPILTIGTDGAGLSSSGIEYKVQASYNVSGGNHGWDDPLNICINVLTLSRCSMFFVPHTYSGHTGLKFNPTNAGMGYNLIVFGSLDNAKMGLEVHGVEPGWFNQNVIKGSKIRTSSNIPAGEDRWAIYIHNTGYTGNRFNGNVFQGCSAELSVGSVAGKGMFLYGESIAGTQFNDIRLEATDPTYLAELDGNLGSGCHFRVLNRATDTNSTHYLFDHQPGFTNDHAGIVEYTDNPNNWENIFNSGRLVDRVAKHSQGHTLEGFTFVSQQTGAQEVYGPLSVLPDAVLFAATATPFVEITFEDEDTKTLRVRSVAPNDFRTRLYILAADENGNQLVTEDTVAWCTHGYFNGNSLFGGGHYQTASDLNSKSESYITLRGLNSAGFPAVKKVYIGWSSSTELESFTIDKLSYTAAKYTQLLDAWKLPGKASDQIPTDPSFIGDTVRNLAPSSTEYIGWTYTSTGWKGYGLIA
jgi:hypothetical protein